MAVVASPSTPVTGGQQLSEACAAGTIQLPPDGNPVVLLADHQTTGGYTVPGVVARADLWQARGGAVFLDARRGGASPSSTRVDFAISQVGQARPGDLFELVATSEAEAVAALQAARRVDAEPVEGGDDLDLDRLRDGVNQMGSAPDMWRAPGNARKPRAPARSYRARWDQRAKET